MAGTWKWDEISSRKVPAELNGAHFLVTELMVTYSAGNAVP
jgi:hypothetical protein